MNILKEEIRDKKFVAQLIPQKEPIIMVDALLHFSVDKIISGLTIEQENMFEENGFLTEPGIIEHMAQTVALHTGYRYFLEEKPAPVGFIGAIKKVEIHKLPEVKQEITTAVVVLHDILGVTLVQTEATCNGELIAFSEMKTVLV